MLVDTPLEVHHLNGVPILVKREDLCSPYPGPSFSKMRGVVEHIKNRPESVIGVLDTLHSKAGWCVAYVCSQLGKKCINYWPRYKADSKEGLPRQQQIEAQKNGATMIALPAGRSAILYHTAKKHIKTHATLSGYLMPNALKLPESITANAREAYETAFHLRGQPFPDRGAIVISISSGTVASGVLSGLHQALGPDLRRFKIILHMGYSRSFDAAREYIQKASGLPLENLNVEFVDEGYGYADKVSKETWEEIPFPSNPHYDAKAWSWLSQHGRAQELYDEHGSVIFWNIGS